MKLALFLSILLLLTIPQQTHRIGVAPGNYAKWSFRFTQIDLVYHDPTMRNITGIYNLIKEITILAVNDSRVTYRQRHLLPNGSERTSKTFTVDPTLPIYSTYESGDVLEAELQTFLIPSGLNAGDPLPQPVWLPNPDGEPVAHEWIQRINSTTTEGPPWATTQINHIKWSKELHIESSGYPFTYRVEVSGSYDKKTGIMLNYEYIQIGTRYLPSGAPEFYYFRKYEYRLINSSTIANPNVIPTILILFSLAIYTVYAVRRVFPR